VRWWLGGICLFLAFVDGLVIVLPRPNVAPIAPEVRLLAGAMVLAVLGFLFLLSHHERTGHK
jgi:hypothetical protein